MSSLDDKILELEKEYQLLEHSSPTVNRKYIYYGFLSVPIVVYMALYILNFKYFQVDGKRNRKKILKFTFFISLFLIVALYYMYT